MAVFQAGITDGCLAKCAYEVNETQHRTVSVMIITSSSSSLWYQNNRSCLGPPIFFVEDNLNVTEIHIVLDLLPPTHTLLFPTMKE